MPSRRTFLKTLGLLGLTACSRPAVDATPSASRETGTPRTLLPTSTRVTPSRTAPALPTPTRTMCRTGSGEAAFLAGHEVFRGDTSRNVILMTYDDFAFTTGAAGDNFDKILSAYKDLRCKTTFFLPGGYENVISLDLMAPVIERIVTEGHAFGCHGLFHVPQTPIPDDSLRANTEQWLKIVRAILPGYAVRWFRAPFGDTDARVRAVYAEYGMQSVKWSVESNGMIQDTLRHVIDTARPGDIVLSHSQREFDANYARTILAFLLDRGFSVESVETGLAPGDYYHDPCVID
ncbi:MAG: polysaccharide deacetylase family protein [Anaerolineales bacterium]